MFCFCNLQVQINYMFERLSEADGRAEEVGRGRKN